MGLEGINGDKGRRSDMYFFKRKGHGDPKKGKVKRNGN
jgi:hypothetical protein